jgi:vacuolar-type H+-ATPase subunit I/STV1
VVLLALSSFFLAATVVTYVSNAEDFKALNKDLNRQLDAARGDQKVAETQLNEAKAKFADGEDSLNKRLAELQTNAESLKESLNLVEREKAQLLQKVNKWTSVVEDFSKTNDGQRLMLDDALAQVNELKAGQIRLEKELKETTAALIEKMAVIDTLGADKKRLVEQATSLQARLDSYLRPIGETAAAPTTVTQPIEVASAVSEVMPIATDIDLNGLVDSVDLKNSVTQISVGSADGVKLGMKFYATRGDDFICEILVVDVDKEKAVGVLQLVQQSLQVGDTVSTNL